MVARLAWICVALLLASAAHAQNGAIHVTPYAGVAVPLGEFGDRVETGFHSGAQIELGIDPRWSVVLDGFWSRFEPAASGDSVSASRDDESSMFAGAFEVKYRVPDGPVWVFGGFGWRRIREPEAIVSTDLTADSLSAVRLHRIETEWRFAFNLGAGGAIGLTERVSAVAEGMVDLVSRRNMLAVRAGLRFRLH